MNEKDAWELFHQTIHAPTVLQSPNKLVPHERALLIAHTQSVTRVAKKAAVLFNADEKEVELGAIFHDLGKIVQTTNHAQYSLEIVARAWKNIPDSVSEAILYHKASHIALYPEAAAVQVADRLCYYDSHFQSSLFAKLQMDSYLRQLQKKAIPNHQTAMMKSITYARKNLTTLFSKKMDKAKIVLAHYDQTRKFSPRKCYKHILKL